MTTAVPPLPSGLALWLAGARPRTLPISVAPVIVGIGCAASVAEVAWWRGLAALVVSLFLQIGVNYANDYSDGIRGTDANRVGPARLTASGAVPAPYVRNAAFFCFGLASVLGFAVALATSMWLLVVGACCVLAAWFYTGGKHPYGYYGFGELVVFLNFGLIAVIGTSYVATDPAKLSWLSVVAALPVGLLAVAVLVVNNLRDIPRDAESGKRTLAVVLGDRGTRALYVATTIAPYLIAIGIAVAHPWVLLTLPSAVLAIDPIRRAVRGDTGRDLIPPLATSGKLTLIFGALLALGIAL